MTFTTGVGFDAPRAPLHFDSRMSGQEAPAGLTVYGPYDADSLPEFAKGNEWVHIYLLSNTVVPSSWGWPATESYMDLFLWPMMNELTIRQNMGPTSYYWGYLAARDALK
jgi:endoglucanase